MKSQTSPAVDYADVTSGQQAMWATGDFNEIARQNMGMAEALCQAVDPRPGQRVLDAACGSGNAALVAARRYCEVIGIDYVPALIDRARSRASADGWGAEFAVGDVQDLPFPDASFDVVLSVYGVQFAPDQRCAASELLRVCRPGGKIGLSGPIPEGWSGDWFATHARYVPPPPGIPSPLHWGTNAGLTELLGPGTQSIESEERTAVQYYRSIDHAVEVFTTYFGPTVRALEAIDIGAQHRMRGELKSVFRRYDRACDGPAAIENRYLQCVATRASDAVPRV